MSKTCTKCEQSLPLSSFYLRVGNDRPKPRYMSQCKECTKAEVRHRNSTAEGKAKRRDEKLRAAYGIDSSEYESMYKEQGGKCYVCQEARDVLHVDHNHETGEVRKLLCTLCNTAFGKLKEDVNIIQRLLDYGKMYDHT